MLDAAHTLKALIDSHEKLITELTKKRLVQRYMTLPDAASYLGLKGRDPQYRQFKRFLSEEGIKYKPGNGGKPLVRIADLDAAMARNLIHFTSK